MTAGGRRTGGLAARIVRVTLIIGVLTAATAGTVAVIGASRLAINQVEGRDQATLQFVEDQIVQRLASAETVASRVAAIVATAPDHASLDLRIAPVFDSGNGLVDEIIVSTRRGDILTAYPSAVETQSVVANAAFKGALSGTTGFYRDKDGGTDSGFWLSRAAAGPTGTQVVILLHLDLGSLRVAIQEMREIGDRSLWVMDSATPVMRAGRAGSEDMTAARWKPTGPFGGQVTLASSPNGSLTGLYADLHGIEGVSWRIVCWNLPTRWSEILLLQ
jgi:hypothetical protein